MDDNNQPTNDVSQSKSILDYVVWIAIVLFIVYFALVLCLPFSRINILGRAYYVSQVLVGFFLILTFVLAICQYLLSARQFIETQKKERERINLQIEEIQSARRQKAINLAGFYKDRIIVGASLISRVYKASGLYAKVIRPTDKMLHFDVSEKNTLFPDNDEAAIAKLMGTEDFCNIVKELKFFVDEEKIKEEDPFFAKLAEKKVATLIQRVLNDLEYFAMHFVSADTNGVSCTADEKFVYQSLHQTYIELVSVLYRNISVNNISNSEKYFTNVILLFRKWDDRARANLIKEKAVFEDANKKTQELVRPY